MFTMPSICLVIMEVCTIWKKGQAQLIPIFKQFTAYVKTLANYQLTDGRQDPTALPPPKAVRTSPTFMTSPPTRPFSTVANFYSKKNHQNLMPQISFFLHQEMLQLWSLAILLLFPPSASAFGVGIWIGGGISGQPPPGLPDSKLNIAFTALQAWKSAITDDPHGILATWVGSDVCSYKGVYCTQPQDMSTDLVVAGIDLNHASLQGTLVTELSLLSDLSIMHLNSNRFTGTVPESFRDLVYLSELDLSNNQFSGPFPSVILLIPNLIYLDIRYNRFSGPVPEELFNKDLDAIFLNNNLFGGQIPQNLGSSPASVISFANNRFSGSIPASFGYMGTGIKEVLFLNNQLTGCIPEGVGLLSEIEVLDLSYNALSGHLPDTISCLSEIEVLNLAHNQLSGVLQELVCGLRSLANLTVSFNFFSGFDQECSRLPFRNVGFDFSGNCIPGKNMQRPPPECSGIPGVLNCLRIPLASCG